MFLAKCLELFWRAADVQTAFSLKGRHVNRFFGRQNFCCFAHEFDTSNDERLGTVVSAKPSHLQRIRDAPASFISQILDILIHIVMSNQSGTAFLQQRLNFCFQLILMGLIEDRRLIQGNLLIAECEIGKIGI